MAPIEDVFTINWAVGWSRSAPPIRADLKPRPYPFAFPEAERSEAIRDLYPSDGGKDPGSSRSDLSVETFVRGRSGEVVVSQQSMFARLGSDPWRGHLQTIIDVVARDLTPIQRNRVSAGIGKPRRSSVADIGFLPAR